MQISRAPPPPVSPFRSLDPTLFLVLRLLGLLFVVTQSGLALGELDPGVGNGNSLQYSCLEHSTERGAWWGKVHGGHQEEDMTEQLSMHENFEERGSVVSLNIPHWDLPGVFPLIRLEYRVLGRKRDKVPCSSHHI